VDGFLPAAYRHRDLQTDREAQGSLCAYRPHISRLRGKLRWDGQPRNRSSGN
jgi:hypothetical protein